MKAWPISMFAACLLSCSTKHESAGSGRFSSLPEAPLPPAALIQQGPPPPWIWIGKRFKNPGRYDWTNGMTLLMAVSIAGGFTNNASRFLELQRWSGPSEIYRLYGGSLEDMLGNPTNDPPLLPGDGVSVVRFL